MKDRKNQIKVMTVTFVLTVAIPMAVLLWLLKGGVPL